jgi:hypothetical protein
MSHPGIYHVSGTFVCTLLFPMRFPRSLRSLGMTGWMTVFDYGVAMSLGLYVAMSLLSLCFDAKASPRYGSPKELIM